MHKQVAKDHGFTAIANVDIMDEDGSMEITVPAPASGPSTITEDYVGAHITIHLFRSLTSRVTLRRSDKEYVDRYRLIRGKMLDTQRRNVAYKSVGRESG